MADPGVSQNIPGMSLVPNASSVETFQPSNINPSIIQYQDEREKLNSALQIEFLKNLGDSRNTSCYEKVAVLLLSWDAKDNDLNTQAEVDELSDVLETIYHYKVRKECLTRHGKRPQVQMQWHLVNFLHDEDGPRTLLIVYYAGHGKPGQDPGDLELAAKYLPKMGPVGDSVQWNLVEANLQGTEADVFEIFDCCYAGNFRSNEFSTRIFEFLAATSAGNVTRSPGKSSFTSALIWGLRQFAKAGEKFTTSELTNRIKEAPHFPKEQVPVLCERNAASSLRIVLAPLPEGKSQQEQQQQQQHSPTPMWASNQEDREVLTLKLVLEKLPDKTDIARLAKVVKQLIAGQHMLVNRVLWGGIHSQTESNPNLDHLVKQAVKKFLEPVARRRSSAYPIPSPVSSPSDQSFLVPPLTAPNGGLAKKRRRSTSDCKTE